MLHDAREASRALPSVTMPDAAWTKVDDTWLPSGWQQRGDLVVERYPDGQLSRLVRLVGDVASYELTLAHGQPRGRVTDHQERLVGERVLGREPAGGIDAARQRQRDRQRARAPLARGQLRVGGHRGGHRPMLHDARTASRGLPSVTMPDGAWTRVDDTWLPSGWQQRSLALLLNLRS